MSHKIRRYRSIDPFPSKDMELTAFVGGKKYGDGIAFTIGREYCCLSERQLLDLIEVIAKRLASKRGFGATEGGKAKTVLPDGTIEDEEDD